MILQSPISVLSTYEYIPKILYDPIFIIFYPGTLGLNIINAFS